MASGIGAPVNARHTDVEVFILAGGQSSRMGTDKARVLVDGQPLISRVASAFRSFGTLHIVGGDPHLVDLVGRPARHLPDRHPGEGPLGAILTALSTSRSSSVDGPVRSANSAFIVVAACDLANLDEPTAQQLVHDAHHTDADVVVPMVGGERQWHLAVWNVRVLAQLDAAFTNGIRSLRAAATPLRQTVVVTSDISKYIDLDSPEDISSFRPYSAEI